MSIHSTHDHEPDISAEQAMDTVEDGPMAGPTDTVIEPDIDHPVMSAECGRPTICVDDSTHVETSNCARVSPQTTGIEIASEEPVDDGDLKTMMQYLNDLGEAPIDTTLGTTQLPHTPPPELGWQDFIFEQPPPTQTHFGSGPPVHDEAPNHSVDSRGLVDTTGDTNELFSPPHPTAKRKISSLDQKSDESSEHQFKRARVATADEESAEGFTTTMKFSTKEGKSAFGNLASQLLAQEQNSRNSRNSRWRRTRDETTSIDKVALAKTFKNKPIARSCWGCVHLEGAEGVSQCSLLENHGQWPCHACAQDDLHCDLITPPTRKVRCTDCRRQNLLCSYSYTRNHEQACEQCAKDGHRCVAGPAKDGGIIPRIGIMRADDDGDEIESEDNIRYVPTLAIPSRKGKAKVAEDCRECAYSGGKCNYPINLSTGPCRSCKRQRLPCTMPNAPAPKKFVESFHPARSQARQTQAASPATKTRALAMPRKRRDSVLDSVEVTRGTSHITSPMSTNYRHPMVFNCPAEFCSFCDEPDMQVTGMGMKQPEVANIPEYSGFVEISGGHAEKGMPITRLCSGCTMSRLSILYCSCHITIRIDGVSYSEKAQAAAQARLLDDDVEDLDRHCHLCFRLATFSCGAETLEGDDGCGMKLCERCSVRLMGEHDKDLGGLITAMVDQGEDCRADAELLKSDGALMRYGHWQAQCEIER